jgi:hypothetical protein
MDAFLGTYTHRIAMDPALFVLSAGSISLAALTTVCLQVLKAATVNPVDSLRHE